MFLHLKKLRSAFTECNLFVKGGSFMNAIRRVALLLLLVLTFTVFLSAQKQALAPPPQSSRQALLEMMNGGQNGVMKHLTVEVQQLLKQPGNQQALLMLGMFDSIKSQSGGELQTFETGPVLLAVNEPNQHQKFEVHVENDDLNGDQNTLELSLHLLRDGQEQQDEWGYLSSRIKVTMNRQQEIWRLSNVGVGLEIPLGDPEFLKKTFLKSLNSEGATGVGVVAPSASGMASATVGASEVVVHPETTATFQATELPPSSLATMLGVVETVFARQHPETGFTCSLPDLAETGKGFNVDPQVSTGIYKGYRISLSGCQGKPAGSFQISLEPVSGGGGKAYCIDATQNVRASDDGRGATCLTSGKLESQESIGLEPVASGVAIEPKH